jgi:hypothetical protein
MVWATPVVRRAQVGGDTGSPTPGSTTTTTEPPSCDCVSLRSACTAAAPFAVDVVFDCLVPLWEVRVDIRVTALQTGAVLYTTGLWLATDAFGAAEINDAVPAPHSSSPYGIDIDFFPDQDHNLQHDDQFPPGTRCLNGGAFFSVIQPCTVPD